MIPLIVALLTVSTGAPHLAYAQAPVAQVVQAPDVPSYSQFKDIQSPTWQKVGCGITDLAMIINFYKPNAVSVNALLKLGIAAGAYEKNVGWIYQGLIDLSHKYGLDGQYYDLSKMDMQTAFAQFKNYLKEGPVILSVHYKFDPKSTIPHLVVINRIADNVVYYNDPAAPRGEKQISVADFLKGWKRKVIAIRPAKNSVAVAVV